MTIKYIYSLISFLFMALIVVIIFSITYGSKDLPSMNQPINSPHTMTQSITKVITPTSTPFKFSHIFLVVMENHSANDLLNSSQAPFINSLASNYSIASNYQNIAHPSLPNYIALISGDTYGISSDCTGCYLNKPNLADEFETKGVSWKAYMESMPTPCFIGSSYPYAQKHNPFIYFDDIRLNHQRCAERIVPLTQMTKDITNNSLPEFSFITPNICNDMHDCSVSTGDNWLKQTVTTIMNTDAYKDHGMIVITFDENDSYLLQSPILTILVSPDIKKGFSSNKEENHYSLLRLIEDNWSLPHLGNSSTATLMNEYLSPDI